MKTNGGFLDVEKRALYRLVAKLFVVLKNGKQCSSSEYSGVTSTPSKFYFGGVTGRKKEKGFSSEYYFFVHFSSLTNRRSLRKSSNAL
jgi:hypothetical protein